MILVYITCRNQRQARDIARHLLKKRLMACANIIPGINSIYPWKGKLVDDKESVLIIKTKGKYYSKIKNEVKKVHSYKIPCILKINAEANSDYRKWLESVLK